MKKVIILLPTYNEKEIIKLTLSEVSKNARKINEMEIEILVVDSCSPDKTGDIVREAAAKDSKIHLLEVKERGLGLGLVRGYEEAFGKLNADIVLQMDSDLQHDPKDIPKLLSPFKDGFDFVQGSRFIKGGGNNLEIHRQFLSWAANLASRILFGAMKIHEFTTSFRAFTKQVYEKIDFEKIPYRGRSFIFQPAFLQAVLELKVKIKEVPIIFTDRTKGYSKMDMINYSLDLLKYGVKIRLKKHKQFIKFCVVGTSGATLQSIIYGVLKSKIDPALAIMLGAETAIINGFYWNNKWTYNDRQIKGFNFGKFIQYNLGSLGSLFIQGLSVKGGTYFFGRSQFIDWFFACLGVSIGLIWNFFFYSQVVWKKRN